MTHHMVFARCDFLNCDRTRIAICDICHRSICVVHVYDNLAPYPICVDCAKKQKEDKKRRG